jgi:small subunit ribosomal protein S16
MAVVIRMKRSGRKNRPCYKISVADSRSPRDGRVLESLGLYDPIASAAEMRVSLDVERARHWIEHGAVPSETVRSLFKRPGVFGEPKPPKKRDRSGRKKPTKAKERRTARITRVTAGRTERSTARKAARAAAKAAAAESAGAGEAKA